jgi:prephenate dehydratase
MALGEITRQLAQQAIGNAMKEPAAPAKAAGPAAGENACATILGQVQAMQKALKDDEELVVTCHAGAESVRVMEFFAPTARVLVATGTDAEKNVTRVVSHVEAVQLVCKVMKSAKPARIGFVAPRPKPE